MPISNNEIPPIDHKDFCQGPNLAALSIRTQGYDEEKKKRTRSSAIYAIVCLSCKVQVNLPFNITGRRVKKLKNSILALPRLLSEKDLSSIDEIEHKLTNTRVKTKEEQRVISPFEKKMRTKVRELIGIYKKDVKICPRLQGRIDSNLFRKILDEFLDSRPTWYQVRKLMYWSPLYRYSRKKANRRRGWIPNFQDGGFTLDYDHLHFNLEYDNHAQKINRLITSLSIINGNFDPKDFDPTFTNGPYAKLPNVVDLDELSPWEKLVIEEYQGRLEYMHNATKENLRSRVLVYNPVENEDKKQKLTSD